MNVVWLKKDVRLHDHAVLNYVMQQPNPILIIYLFEPSLISTPESDVRHWRFAYQGIQDFRGKIGHNKILVLHAEALDALKMIAEAYAIQAILSHQETGLEITYRRDQAVRKWCKRKGINWKTFERDGVRRNIPDRRGWQKYWDDYMNGDLFPVDVSGLNLIRPNLNHFQNGMVKIPDLIAKPDPSFQRGGETKAMKLLESFTQNRAKSYLKNLARPSLSQETCSRLSPYIAHGHVSARHVYQETKAVKDRLGRNIDQFHNRLWWRCHYIQKLETEYTIEKEPINRGFIGIEKEFRPDYYKAWSNGSTGFPMIDASMRCLIETGYLNFRMRAMLATFWSFTLWQDWRIGAAYLAKVFLDFEPGIHYPQFQMQAGMTGYHPMRIFNPILQAKKYDDYGVFIKKWVHELGNVPENLLATPWELSQMEQNFYNTHIGKDYPYPLVNYDQATREAKEKYWAYRNSEHVRKNLPELWRKHSLPKDIINYEEELNIQTGLVTESVMYNPKP
ncbi:MAG: deoxyribodipyrimidine photo-lyase/cryptochrome family protein [Fulvivirga sp.]